ncbi:hypothetical protein VD0002_g4756 [Verticillium dahliae]|uniref:AB hydrolase-1 domain-containing protein n=2 Tax=Verticillium dahliae TaxID=27337 RepID=G2XHD5_VERDV|nr:uncharacterized protein VDAG_09567 [Verticillium dahliae VdLs.17]KAF3344535.1 hypothetical protein VdG2_07223 [Verticillium dahliae VDG2]KAH6688796.1 hypothetical protein EV126DRAFT_123353 [Verticillium dahliae]EGY19233.1 hypothetical protein VDAG_09567 [Verticillium dahliae VdLs.17]PNH28467.1 hypothetical protein BJF96_g8235 [Verticillium dahliae]PNH50882.1 hypothetical protein VD0003_g6331 [Verticillium dahliae]
MIVGQSHFKSLAFRVTVTLVNYIGLVTANFISVIVFVSGLHGLSSPLAIILLFIAIPEVIFYLAWFLPYRFRLQGHGPKPVPLSRSLRKSIFKRGLDHVPDVEQYIRKWHSNAHYDDIRQDNYKEWLLWALFDRDGDLGDDSAELDDYIQYTEEKGELKIKKGQGDAVPIRLTYDPVEMTHRSLTFYTLVGLADAITTVIFLAKGFKFYRQPRSTFFTTFPFRFKTLLSPNASPCAQLSYFHRPHTSSTHRPLIFLHGGGIGLAAYRQWLTSLPRDVGVLALEILPISSHISGPLPTTHELLSALAAILYKHDVKDAILIGHSFGTLLTSPMLQRPDIAGRIASIILADPVSLLLHLPDVSYNLTRRAPRRGRPNDWQTRFWASDPGMAHTLARRLCWHDFVLWTEQLQGRRTTVVLGGDDSVVNADAVASYIYYGDVKYSRQDRREWRTTPERWTGQEELALLYLEGKDHGHAFLSAEGIKSMTRVVEAYGALNQTWGTRAVDLAKLEKVLESPPMVPSKSKPIDSIREMRILEASAKTEPLSGRKRWL